MGLKSTDESSKVITQNPEGHLCQLSHLGDHNISVCAYMYSIYIKYNVCVCIWSVFKQTNKINQKINPQCRKSTSLGWLALWFPSVYSASAAGVFWDLQTGSACIAAPTSTFKLIHAHHVSTSADASSLSLTQSGSPLYRCLWRGQKKQQKKTTHHSIQQMTRCTNNNNKLTIP